MAWSKIVNLLKCRLAKYSQLQNLLKTYLIQATLYVAWHIKLAETEDALVAHYVLLHCHITRQAESVSQTYLSG